ncbi:MAG: DegT/DnrJ/EryC1/StrS family aminotransferase [Thermodesulfobacteriota bacterium]
MQFIDLKTQQQRILPQLNARLQAVLAHGQYILGPENRELEARLAEYVGTKHALACSSGTDALLIALMAYGVGPGDAVFTTPFTFMATAEVISLTGATPVFVDIDPATFNIDPHKLAQAAAAVVNNDPSLHPLPQSDRPLTARGVIAVDLFGLAADYRAIMAVAAEHDLFVLEDAAQSFGAFSNGRRAGGLGHVAATSFFPAKPLGCYGDGGAVFTDDDRLAETMRSLRVHGQGSDRYDNVRIGINGRLDTMQAAVLLCKLDIFDEELAARQRIAARYSELLADAPSIRTPHVPEGCISAWAQYSLLSKNRDAILSHLQRRSIPHAIYYPIPLHLQKAYEPLDYRAGSMPEAERAAGCIFSLPMHPYLEDGAIAEIAAAVKEAIPD